MGVFELLAESAVWRLSSAFALVAVSLVWGLTLWTHGRLNRAGHPPQFQYTLVVGMSTPPLALVALLPNLVGWPWPPAPSSTWWQ